MSDAWETLAAVSTSGDAWERLNNITGGSGVTTYVDVFSDTTFSELIVADTFTAENQAILNNDTEVVTFTQADYEVFIEIDTEEL